MSDKATPKLWSAERIARSVDSISGNANRLAAIDLLFEMQGEYSAALAYTTDLAAAKIDEQAATIARLEAELAETQSLLARIYESKSLLVTSLKIELERRLGKDGGSEGRG